MNLELFHDLVPEGNVLSREVRYAIYGTGSFAQQVFQVMTSHGFEVVGWIDNRRIGERLLGLEVYAIDDSRIANQPWSTVLGVHNREVSVQELIWRLKSAGFGKIFTPFDLVDHFPDELRNLFWLAPRKFYGSNRTAIMKAYALLSDELSRQNFVAVHNFRATGDYSLLPSRSTGYQYFSEDLPPVMKPLRLVDCGAFDGDTLRDLVAADIDLEAAFAFEPDIGNFAKLKETALTCNARVVLWPCAVGSSSGKIGFSEGQGESSAVDPTNQSSISCVALDDVLVGQDPTMIKMDIEGAEISALEGCRRLITESHPILAVCTYHTPEHFWEIPLLIETIARQGGLQYEYYFRCYAHNSFDSVFFAFPCR